MILSGGSDMYRFVVMKDDKVIWAKDYEHSKEAYERYNRDPLPLGVEVKLYAKDIDWSLLMGKEHLGWYVVAERKGAGYPVHTPSPDIDLTEEDLNSLFDAKHWKGVKQSKPCASA
jgi:hypothetical protein